jgi:NAD(P)-dependent dehydrogenase (short-subunit alcohol dehydrogenase family)
LTVTEPFLEGKAALVTAGSRRLGAAIATALAARGADVAVNFHKSSEVAEALVESLSGGGAHVAVRGDVGTAEGTRRLVADAGRALGGRTIQVLVNNCGPFAMTPFAEMAEEEWDRIWDTNVKAAFVASQELAPEMRAAGWGRIINVSAGSAYLRNHSIYTLAKASLQTLTESLAIELGPEITVNAITPGQIAESADVIAEFDHDFVGRAIEHTPLGRLVTRAEVAAIAAELCGPLFSGVTGATIPIDGGWHLPRF